MLLLMLLYSVAPIGVVVTGICPAQLQLSLHLHLTGISPHHSAILKDLGGVRTLGDRHAGSVPSHLDER